MFTVLESVNIVTLKFRMRILCLVYFLFSFSTTQQLRIEY